MTIKQRGNGETIADPLENSYFHFAGDLNRMAGKNERRTRLNRRRPYAEGKMTNQERVEYLKKMPVGKHGGMKGDRSIKIRRKSQEQYRVMISTIIFDWHDSDANSFACGCYAEGRPHMHREATCSAAEAAALWEKWNQHIKSGIMDLPGAKKTKY